MTAKELIEELGKLDLEMEVVVMENGEPTPIESAGIISEICPFSNNLVRTSILLFKDGDND